MVPIEAITTIAELPGVVARYCAEKLALSGDDGAATYRELDVSSNRIAHALARDSVRPGDRVVLIGRDSLALVAAFFGVAKAKTVAVPVNFRLAPDEIAHVLEDAEPRFVFFEPEVAANLEPALARLATRPRSVSLSAAAAEAPSLETWSSGLSAELPGLTYEEADVVVQLYTSGTTGRPKGALLPNRTFFALPRELAARRDPWMGWSHEDVNLLLLPTFHVGGLWGLMRGLALGGENIVLKGFEPARILDIVQRKRVTMIGLVPAMMQVLLAEPSAKTTDFSSLGKILYGGSPISAALLERARAAFGCNFCQIYGLTETGNMAISLRPEDHFDAGEERLLAAGRPLPGVDVRIVTRDGRQAGVREVGEIAIRSPAQMLEYWKLPEATRTTIVDGWIMTGDGGYRDEQGFIYVCDRLKDMIICAGENVYSTEVENVIRSHEAVLDVAVIGIPDELWGEAVLAFVVPRPGTELKASDIVRHARARLADFKVPRSVEFLDKLPRTATGKVMKNKLREPYWQGRVRQIN